MAATAAAAALSLPMRAATFSRTPGCILGDMLRKSVFFMYANVAYSKNNVIQDRCVG